MKCIILLFIKSINVAIAKFFTINVNSTDVNLIIHVNETEADLINNVNKSP